MRVLIVEPWMAGSHRQWAEGFAARSRNDVSIVGLPEGPWRWRLRAGALPLADLVATDVSRHGSPDVLVVSGLVDVAQLMGLTRRVLPASTPVVVYQHESQLVYPTANGTINDDAALRNWHSWCAADLVLFNSDHHRMAVTEALPAFLARQPEDDQAEHWPDVLRRFETLPVGVDLPPAQPSTGSGPPLVLWPHRWEPDKDPDAFAAAVAELDASGVPFGLVLAGEEGVVPSTARDDLISRLAHRVVAAGPFDRAEYLQWVATADVVVSCARHEFFGVAVVEAMAAGCVPVLPDALSYPQLVPDEFHAAVLYEPGSFTSALRRTLTDLERARQATQGLPGAMARFDWSIVAPDFDGRLARLVS